MIHLTLDGLDGMDAIHDRLAQALGTATQVLLPAGR